MAWRCLYAWMLSNNTCASICLRPSTYPIIRTWFSDTVAGIPRIEESMRVTGNWRPGGERESQKIWICIAIFCLNGLL